MRRLVYAAITFEIYSRINASDSWITYRKIVRLEPPFEPRSGETLEEQPHYFAGLYSKQSDAFTMRVETSPSLSFNTIILF